MKINQVIKCLEIACKGVEKESYSIPIVNIEPLKIRALLISEAMPADPSDYYYADGDPLFQRTTVHAFNDAGLKVGSIKELIDLGFYFTTAVKCGKTGYNVPTEVVKKCSSILQLEIELFPNLEVVLLMGDVAIKAFNDVARRSIGKRVIPAGPTYKIRKTPYYFGRIRVFPSYLQAGPSFFIEKTKRRMIAEDLTEAIRILGL